MVGCYYPQWGVFVGRLKKQDVCIPSVWGAGKVKVFKNPIKLDTRGRKFKINDVQYKTQVSEEVPEGRVFTVKGSKGDEYKVSELNGEYSCTCSGFRFRAKCKHTESVRQEV